jgi:hypothetical protein
MSYVIGFNVRFWVENPLNSLLHTCAIIVTRFNFPQVTKLTWRKIGNLLTINILISPSVSFHLPEKRDSSTHQLLHTTQILKGTYSPVETVFKMRVSYLNDVESVFISHTSETNTRWKSTRR